MSDIPKQRKYTRSHEWVQTGGDATVTVGITDHAQASLGDLVFVELPEIGTAFAAGDVAAVVESVKAASDIYAPVAGDITQVNAALADAPETINEDPFGQGWLFKLALREADALDDLLDADAYAGVVAEDDA